MARLFLLLALTLPVVAQSPADITTLSIVTQQNWVLSAATLPLDVTAADFFGSSIPGYVPAWVSRNPDIATVDAGGVVTGLAPGVAIIEADAPNGIVATAVIGVYPS